MSKKTRKDAAAEIRKLREENAQLMSEIAASRFDLAGAREEVKKHLKQIATLESKVAYYKKLLDEAMVLCANVLKDATAAVTAAEKYRAKAEFWRFYCFAVSAGVIIYCVAGLFLK